MKNFTLLLILLFYQLAVCQVGVNTTTPDASSMLDISATDKGVLVPRVSLSNVTLTTLDGTNTAATGLLIWNTNASIIGGNGIGFYFYNGTQWMPITQTASTDDDWYEVGTGLPANSINDNIYTQGFVGIGATNPIYPLVISSNSSIGLNLSNNSTDIMVKGVSNSVNSISDFRYAIENTISGTSGAGLGQAIGVQNNMSNQGGDDTKGVRNFFTNTQGRYITGVENTFSSTATATNDFYGYLNQFSISGSPVKGLYNFFSGQATNYYGVDNDLVTGNTTNGNVFGLRNTFNTSGNGTHYGSQTTIQSSGTGTKYGHSVSITATAGGTKYGYWASVPDLINGYAGYFIGRTSLGNTTTNRYLMPGTDGTNGQIMQTDGSGNVAWATPSSGTDDQNLLTPTLSGTTLNLGIENGTGTSINLAPLQDHDWYEIGSTNSPDNINDNIFTQGKVAIGKNTADHRFEVEETGPGGAFPPIIAKFTDNGTSTNSHTGVDVDMNASTTSAETGVNINMPNSNSVYKKGVVSFVQNGTGSNTGFEGRIRGSGINRGVDLIIENSGSTSTNSQTAYSAEQRQATTGQTFGLLNTFATNNLANDTGSKFGVRNVFGENTGGELYGTYNYFDPTLTSIANKYGTFTDIPNTLGGTHYGIYSRVFKPGSYAGFFQGNVAVGTNGANFYILPPSRGTNGQIMQTDGSGNVSWTTPATGTDDQNLTTPTLTGTTLNLGIENGTGTSINLASLQDGTGTDDQIIDNFSLVGTTLRLSLENDGLPLQIVNLAALQDGTGTDDQNLTTPSLTGTILNLGIENGTGTSVNLSGLQDADWHEVGTTSPPNNINDDIFTQGRVGIGDNTPDASLKVEYSGADTKAAIVDFTTTTNAVFPTPSAIPSGLTVNTTASPQNRQLISGLFNISGTMNTGLSSSAGAAILNSVITQDQTSGLVINVDGESDASYGIYNDVISSPSNSNIGTYNNVNGASISNIGGSFNASGTSTTNYGIYSSASGATTNYAGYFLGNVSIGTTTLNNYILPNSRGTNGQIMQTNGAGIVSWVNPPSITDDQNLTLPSLSGTTLNLGIENGTGTSIDLSSLQDADWYEVGGTNPADNITDNIYTGGDVSIGKNTAAIAKVDIESNNKLQSLNLTNSNTTTGIKFGINNTLNVTSNNNFSAAVLNSINGPSEWKYGIRNFFGTISAAAINEIGMENGITSTGNVNLWGYNNFYSPSSSNTGFFNGFTNTIGANHLGVINGVLNSVSSNSNSNINGVNNSIAGTGNATIIGVNTSITNSGSGNKFGERIEITNTLGGTHYGIYSDVTKTNSFAGYFLGNLSVGTTTGNNYILPSSRGTNGQIMQTDGVGNVSWINASPESTTANNGLTETGNNIQLGGTLTQNTTISQGVYSMDINLNSTGDFAIQDNGTDVFFVRDDGNIGMGTSTPAYPVHILDNTTTNTSAVYIDKVDNTTAETSGLFVEKTSAGTGRNHAIFTDVNGTGTAQKYGLFNRVTSTAAGNQYGVRNFISGASPSNQFGTFNNIDNAGTANHYGVYNGMRGSAASNLYGTYNEFDNTSTAANSYGNYTSYSVNSTGTGSKFGTYNFVDPSAGGTHYGTFNNVDIANGWAGYFVGKSYFSNKIGIGEANPSGYLEVRANNTAAEPNINLVHVGNLGSRINFTNTGTTNGNVWTLYGDTDNADVSSFFNIYHPNAGNIIQVRGNGLVGINRTPNTNDLEVNGTASKSTAGGWLANSDKRLKKNIETIEPLEALNKILDLRGVTYLWNDDKTGINRPVESQMGFIAQEIQEIFPDKVSKDNLGYLQTAYGDYDPIIFQAIKALNDKIEKLETENTALKSVLERINVMEAKLNQLEIK